MVPNEISVNEYLVASNKITVDITMMNIVSKDVAKVNTRFFATTQKCYVLKKAPQT